MSKILTLNLSATDIAMAVKSDTYITGQADKSEDMVANAAKAFNEQAGDEQYHKVKLYRTMKGALAKLEAALAEYVETSDEAASVSDTLTPQSTTFTITMTVNNRTTGAFATALAHLAQEYIINTMLYYWWQPIKPALAKDYIAFAADNISDVRRCLSKSAPSSSTVSYTEISGSIVPSDGGNDSGQNDGGDNPGGDTPTHQPDVDIHVLGTYDAFQPPHSADLEVGLSYLVPFTLFSGITGTEQLLADIEGYDGEVDLYLSNSDCSDTSRYETSASDPSELGNIIGAIIEGIFAQSGTFPYTHILVCPSGAITTSQKLYVGYTDEQTSNNNNDSGYSHGTIPNTEDLGQYEGGTLVNPRGESLVTP